MPSSRTDAVRLGRAEELVCVDERTELDAGVLVAAHLGRAEELVQVVIDEGGECDTVPPPTDAVRFGRTEDFVWVDEREELDASPLYVCCREKREDKRSLLFALLGERFEACFVTKTHIIDRLHWMPHWNRCSKRVHPPLLAYRCYVHFAFIYQTF